MKECCRVTKGMRQRQRIERKKGRCRERPSKVARTRRAVKDEDGQRDEGERPSSEETDKRDTAVGQDGKCEEERGP